MLCGTRGLADVLGNVMLFAPLGAALAWTGRRVWRATLIGAVLSITIETAQLVVPGRYATLSDVLTNTAGAALGAALLLGLEYLRRTRPTTVAPLAIAGGAFAALVFTVTDALVKPDFPPGTWFGQWQTHFEDMGQYRGRVSRVALEDLPLLDGPIAASARARELLRGGGRVRVAGRFGITTGGEAPIFSIADAPGRAILMLDTRGNDLVVRYYSRGESYELTPLRLRYPGLLAGLLVGDSLVIQAWRDGPRWCVDRNGTVACRGFDAGALWRQLAPDWAPAPILLELLWVAALCLPIGYWGRGAGLVAGVAVAIVPLVWLPLSLHAGIILSPLPFAGLAVGVTVGRRVSVALARHSLRGGTRPA